MSFAAGRIDLAERLVNNRKTGDWAVVNAGINSNRLLHNGPGSGALTRFDRDVLSTPGVAAIILFEGINDIGYSTTLPSEAITPAQLIGAYEQLIERAHMHGIAVIGATITPYEGAHYYAPTGEQMRQTVNAWIRGSRVFDGVIDFDAVLRDPRTSVSRPPRAGARRSPASQRCGIRGYGRGD